MNTKFNHIKGANERLFIVVFLFLFSINNIFADNHLNVENVEVEKTENTKAKNAVLFDNKTEINNILDKKELEELQKKLAKQIIIKNNAPAINPYDLVMSKDASKQIEKLLQPVRKIPEDKMIEHILTQPSSNYLTTIIKKDRKYAKALVRFVQDPVAPIKIGNFFENKRSLFSYMMFIVFTIVLNIVLRRKMDGKQDIKFFLGLKYLIIRFTIITSLRIGVFLLLFYDNFFPTYKIIYDVFFRET